MELKLLHYNIFSPTLSSKIFQHRQDSMCSSLGMHKLAFISQHLKLNPRSVFFAGETFKVLCELKKVLKPVFTGCALRNLSAVRDAETMLTATSSSPAARRHCPARSTAALPGLPELPAPRRAGRAEPEPLSRRAASRLCALRESPEQCERDAERARPWGVTSLRSLIRRSACAARAAGVPVTARPLAALQPSARLPPTSRRPGGVDPRFQLPAAARGGGPGTPAPSCKANRVVEGHGLSACNFFSLPLGP